MKSYDQQGFSTGMSDTSGTDKSLTDAYNEPQFVEWMVLTLGAKLDLAKEIAKQIFDAIAAKETVVNFVSKTNGRFFTFILQPEGHITGNYLVKNGPFWRSYFAAFRLPTTSPRTAIEQTITQEESLLTEKPQSLRQKVSGSGGRFFPAAVSNAEEQLKARPQLLRTQSAPDVRQPFSPMQLRKA